MTTLGPELDSAMRSIVNRNLLKYAAGRAITCPHCGDIMDCKRTVLVDGPNCSWVGCAKCWGQGARSWSYGAWSVLDGRVAFAKPRKVKKGR